MKNKLVYIGFAFLHHKGTHAGYHQIKEHLKYDFYIDCQNHHDKSQRKFGEWNVFIKLWRKILSLVFHVSSIPWYIFRILWLNAIHQNLVFHYIYGENTFFPWTKKLMRKSNKVVCTLHQPYSFFQKSQRWKKLIHNTDYIILVGNTEVDKFKKMTGKDNVKYIPHGISTDFYSIDNSVEKEEIVLTVGNWLRDYKFADRVYKRLLDNNPKLSIHIVSNQKNRESISPSDRIKFMSAITDEQLKEEYLKCSLLFLPLTRYTANNSLLEASATGCKIVIASNYPDNSYIPEKYITIVKMEEDPTVEAIMTDMSKEFNESLSTFIVDNYSWNKIAQSTELFLKSI